jgi:Na+/H+ antiporter NhaC
MSEAADPTWLSLLPALVTIALAFATRQVIPALFAGIVTGSLVLFATTGVASDLNFISRFFLPAIGSHKYAQILLIYLWSLGGLIGIWEKTGGARHFAERVGLRYSKSRRGSLFFVWLLGCIFHQGGTVSTVLTGSTAKPVTDRFRVSHEELSYVVDSTSSPVATILPFNAWPIYVGGLAAGTIALVPDDAAGFSLFLRALPFNFYAIIAVISTLLFALGWLPWIPGPMAQARRRVQDGGPLDRPGANPMLVEAPSFAEDDPSDYRPHLADFLVPLGLLLAISAIPVTLGLGSYVNEAFMTAVLSAILIARLRGMTLATILNGLVDGCAKMTIGAIVLGLAVTIAEVAKSLDTAGYLVGIFGGSLPPVALPALLMLLCMLIAFATGTSWGTYAVVVPIALPLAWALQPDANYLAICLGAVLGGGVFGDQCSPISDTTILSSMFSGCDLMDHVKTQLPMALVAAALAAVCATVAAALL